MLSEESRYPQGAIRQRLNPYCNGTCSRSVVIMCTDGKELAVLILIVMEHALGERQILIGYQNPSYVLILIVMEHALGGSTQKTLQKCTLGLNPYCNGTCSRRCYGSHPGTNIEKIGLNPYCNGTCSRSLHLHRHWQWTFKCLNPYCNGTCSRRW